MMALVGFHLADADADKWGGLTFGVLVFASMLTLAWLSWRSR